MKISELPLTTSVTGSEILPIVQGGTTKKVSISDALAGAGGGGVNPSSEFIPYNNGGTFGDSFIFNSLNTGELSTKPAGASYGLKLDFANNYFYFGDFDNVYSGPYIQINSNTGAQEFKVTSPISNGGLKLDMNNNVYYLGDYSIGKGTKIDLINNIYQFGDYLSNAGLFFDSQNKQMGLSSNDVTQEGFWFGNYDNTNRFCSVGFADSGYSYLLLNENDIRTYFNFNNFGLELKLSSMEFYFGGTSGYGAATFYVNNNINICQMGDVAGNNTSAAFGIDVNNETMLATTNLLTPTSSSSSGQHLKINVGGTDYVIELKNP